jgi:hypothetical protein
LNNKLDWAITGTGWPPNFAKQSKACASSRQRYQGDAKKQSAERTCQAILLIMAMV